MISDMSNGTYATHIKLTEQNFILWPNLPSYSQKNIEKLSMSWINPVTCLGFA